MDEHKGISFAMLGIVGVIAVVGIVMMFTGEGVTGEAVRGRAGPPTCSDSDGGANPFVKGILLRNGINLHQNEINYDNVRFMNGIYVGALAIQDVCTQKTRCLADTRSCTVSEASCIPVPKNQRFNRFFNNTRVQEIPCPNGCYDGACLVTDPQANCRSTCDREYQVGKAHLDTMRYSCYTDCDVGGSQIVKIGTRQVSIRVNPPLNPPSNNPRWIEEAEHFALVSGRGQESAPGTFGVRTLPLVGSNLATVEFEIGRRSIPSDSVQIAPVSANSYAEVTKGMCQMVIQTRGANKMPVSTSSQTICVKRVQTGSRVSEAFYKLHVTRFDKNDAEIRFDALI